jgi:hypothetical protein
MYRSRLTRVVGNKVSNPAEPNVLYAGAFSVQVGQAYGVITHPALLSHGLVGVIGERTVRVEVVLGVEWVEDGIVNSGWVSSITLLLLVHTTIQLKPN